jgi:hypothetical protein
MNVTSRLLSGAVIGILVSGIAVAAVAQNRMGDGQGMGHGMRGGHGMMAMLQGVDTTQAEVDELRNLFMNHRQITRTVTNLPNGIRTVTESDNPDLAADIVSHVVGMSQRVDDGLDPQIRIQSLTLDVIFANRDLIETFMEATPTGIIVTQTSSDPETVAALQTHAAEVTEMVNHGMAAVHRAMMQR